jgi:sugar O-acyltransferase (sialic acid O-acetyltransferase NeuD family)
MLEYAILGCSHATVSMLLDTLYELHQREIEVDIIQNVEVEDDLTFHVPEIRTRKILHSHWKQRNTEESFCRFLCGVYQPSHKRMVHAFFEDRYQIRASRYANLVHPAASLSTTAQLSNGVHIGPQAVIAPYAVIGDLVTINRTASIGHHTAVSDFSTINPGCNIAGRCRIGRGVSIGMGANVLDGVRIGDGSIVGAGSLVTKDVAEGVLVYGVPARVVREA